MSACHIYIHIFIHIFTNIIKKMKPRWKIALSKYHKDIYTLIYFYVLCPIYSWCIDKRHASWLIRIINVPLAYFLRYNFQRWTNVTNRHSYTKPLKRHVQLICDICFSRTRKVSIGLVQYSRTNFSQVAMAAMQCRCERASRIVASGREWTSHALGVKDKCLE